MRENKKGKLYYRVRNSITKFMVEVLFQIEKNQRNLNILNGNKSLNNNLISNNYKELQLKDIVLIQQNQGDNSLTKWLKENEYDHST